MNFSSNRQALQSHFNPGLKLIRKSVTNPLIQGNDVITLGSYENDVIMINTPGNSRRMRSKKIISNLSFI